MILYIIYEKNINRQVKLMDLKKMRLENLIKKQI